MKSHDHKNYKNFLRPEKVSSYFFLKKYFFAVYNAVYTFTAKKLYYKIIDSEKLKQTDFKIGLFKFC